MDVICEVNYNKHEITPLALYDKLKVALENNGTYSSKLEYYDECITINYSDVNGIGFSIDIVPSVHEDQETIVSMKSHSTMPELCDSSIAITIDKALDWGSSNPKGFQAWFEKSIKNFLIMEFIQIESKYLMKIELFLLQLMKYQNLLLKHLCNVLYSY